MKSYIVTAIHKTYGEVENVGTHFVQAKDQAALVNWVSMMFTVDNEDEAEIEVQMYELVEQQLVPLQYLYPGIGV